MPSPDTKKLADKIANILEGKPQWVDLAALYASIEKINHRLEKLENPVNPQSAIRVPHSAHPSVDKLNVAEAVTDEIFAGIHREKACAFEPNGKPCDHCAMCSSRGF